MRTTKLPVIITYADFLKQASDFMNINDPGGMLVLEMEAKKLLL
jgi:hypothetical protein